MQSMRLKTIVLAWLILLAAVQLSKAQQSCRKFAGQLGLRVV
jgi:hypothetical protein